MGLFSKKKKPSAAEEAAAQAARAQAAAAQAAAVQAAKAAEVKAAADTKREKEERNVTNIAAKREDINTLQRALDGFEEQRRREGALAIKAKNEKKMNVAKAHARNANRLKQKIAQYETRIVQNQSQLQALEDAAFNEQGINSMQTFNQEMQVFQQNPEEIDDTIQDMRDHMTAIDNVNKTLQADANMNNAEDLLGDLEDLEAEFAEETPLAEIPAVPGEKPQMPVPANPAASEEEEIRRLEADIGI